MSAPKLPELPDFQVRVTTLKASTRKLKVNWSPELANDLGGMHGLRNRRPRTIEESNRLFEMSFRFNELYPPGSIVHLNLTKVLGIDRLNFDLPEIQPIKVTSEAVVLIDKSAIGFLCNESKDDGDFYFLDDLVEFQDGKFKP